MTSEQLEEIKETVVRTVKETVNGKIDKLSIAMESHFKDDKEWKERAQPAIDMGNNIKGFGRVSVYFIGIMSAIGGLYLILRDIFKK